MVLLMGRRVKGSIMIGILFVTFVSWIPDHAATFFGEASQVKGEHDWESKMQGCLLAAAAALAASCYLAIMQPRVAVNTSGLLHSCQC
jgi:xanthine/uracil/vitamin C permease (AzgA family)